MEANYWVLGFGRDCDGYNGGKIVPFADESEAQDYANMLNSGSDGIVYSVTYDLGVLIEYCDQYGKNLLKYMKA
jgi:hypothetical protein